MVEGVAGTDPVGICALAYDNGTKSNALKVRI